MDAEDEEEEELPQLAAITVKVGRFSMYRSLRHVLLALHHERRTACQESNTKVFVTLTQREKKQK